MMSMTFNIKFVCQLTYAKCRYRSFISDSSQASPQMRARASRRSHPLPPSSTILPRLSGSSAAVAEGNSRNFTLFQETSESTCRDGGAAADLNLKFPGKRPSDRDRQRWRGYLNSEFVLDATNRQTWRVRTVQKKNN